jgi:hypothetical protein
MMSIPEARIINYSKLLKSTVYRAYIIFCAKADILNNKSGIMQLAFSMPRGLYRFPGGSRDSNPPR